MAIELTESFVTKIEFVNQTAPSGMSVTLRHDYTYNVRYTSGNMCRGDLDCRIAAAGMEDKIHLNFTSSGIFKYDDNTPKDIIHRTTYDLLYPVANAFSRTLSVNAGMRPINLIKMDIKTSDIYRFDLSNLKNYIKK